jgi:hypothetical protein
MRKDRRSPLKVSTMLRILTLSMLAITAGATSASACYEPSAPSCAASYSEFSDQWDFDRCKREMETYKDDVESFTSCQQSAVERIRSEVASAIDDLNTAVSDFNRRASR